MSSVTSTKVLPAEAGSSTRPVDDGFRVSHFFILLSLIAATVAVIMARPAAPENLVLISLTIGAAGLAAVAFYRTIAPLVAPYSEEDREPLSEWLRADLEREKALTLRSIKELEFDRAMGKLSQQDFDQMAGRLRARAMGIMKQLEAGASAYREQIEKELAARLKSTSRADLPASTEATADRQVGRATNQPSACACGTSNDVDAKFCKSCGAKLAETVR
jgi:hypothetical protein